MAQCWRRARRDGHGRSVGALGTEGGDCRRHTGPSQEPGRRQGEPKTWCRHRCRAPGYGETAPDRPGIRGRAPPPRGPRRPPRPDRAAPPCHQGAADGEQRSGVLDHHRQRGEGRAVTRSCASLPAGHASARLSSRRRRWARRRHIARPRPRKAHLRAVLSTRGTPRAGQRQSRGRPGNPAPEPRSAIRPAVRTAASSSATSESARWSSAASKGPEPSVGERIVGEQRARRASPASRQPGGRGSPRARRPPATRRSWRDQLARRAHPARASRGDVLGVALPHRPDARRRVGVKTSGISSASQHEGRTLVHQGRPAGHPLEVVAVAVVVGPVQRDCGKRSAMSHGAPLVAHVASAGSPGAACRRRRTSPRRAGRRDDTAIEGRQLDHRLKFYQPAHCFTVKKNVKRCQSAPRGPRRRQSTAE